MISLDLSARNRARAPGARIRSPTPAAPLRNVAPLRVLPLRGAATRARGVRAEVLEKALVPARVDGGAGAPLAQWALAWCLQHPAVTCVIPGCKDAEQVKKNAAAAELAMVKADHPQAWKAQV